MFVLISLRGIYIKDMKDRGDYSAYLYNKPRHTVGAHKKSVLTAAVVAVLCVAAVLAANIFAAGPLLVYLPERSCFALCMGSFDERDEAESYAFIIKNRGGAGYIYEEGGEFLVMAASYQTIGDAEAVAKSLTAAGEKVFVTDLSVSARTLPFDGEVTEAAAYKKATDVLYDAFITFNNLAVKIDGEEDTEGIASGVASAASEAAESVKGQIFGGMSGLLTEVSQNAVKLSANCASSDARYAAFEAFFALKF